MKKMGKGDQKMVFIFLSDFTHDVSFVVREFFRFLAKYQSFTETGRRTRARRTIMISSSLLLAGISFLIEKTHFLDHVRNHHHLHPLS